MGGEPLLHPHLESVLYETRSHWQDSRIEVMSNGLLLPKIKTSVFTAVKETESHMTLSRHYDDPYYNPILEAGIDLLRTHGIEPRVAQSHQSWMKCYRIDERGHARPYQSDPTKAWKICYVKHICTTLIDNCLYRCPQLGCSAYAVKKGFVHFDDWKVVLGYQPLMPDCTQEELEAFMKEGVCEQCSICPGEFQHANQYEKINPFGLPVIRNLFCGDPNHE